MKLQTLYINSTQKYILYLDNYFIFPLDGLVYQASFEYMKELKYL